MKCTKTFPLKFKIFFQLCFYICTYIFSRTEVLPQSEGRVCLVEHSGEIDTQVSN
jgi:hypothetical protein